MNNLLVLRALFQRQLLLTVWRQQGRIGLKCINKNKDRCIRCFSRQMQSETHYDILELPMDCSTQEIRSAFVQLSKKYHPDVKGATSNPSETAQFVRLFEAYRVLSKPKSRVAYDQNLLVQNRVRRTSATATASTKTAEVHRPWEVKPNYDPNPNPNAYYGVNGLQRVSNFKIAGALITLAVFGAVFGFVTVRHSFTFSRQQLDEKSAEAGVYHASIRADAEKYGNEEQLRRMANRISRLDR